MSSINGASSTVSVSISPFVSYETSSVGISSIKEESGRSDCFLWGWRLKVDYFTCSLSVFHFLIKYRFLPRNFLYAKLGLYFRYFNYLYNISCMFSEYLPSSYWPPDSQWTPWRKITIQEGSFADTIALFCFFFFKRGLRNGIALRRIPGLGYLGTSFME